MEAQSLLHAKTVKRSIVLHLARPRVHCVPLTAVGR